MKTTSDQSFPHRKGKGFGPVEYLCAVNPFGRGERERAPQVISGNPALIKRQIDAVPFKHKYTSGVHSFAPEDSPTDEQIMEIIEATEELAFAGLPLSSRSILWVKHEHAGRTELHFLIPRLEVNSGKSFNAFPPGWQQKYDPLRDKFNYKYGWARPDDPKRARHWQSGINAKIMQAAKRRGKPNPSAEVFSLTDDLANMAIQGKLASRSDIVSELKRRGYGINRQGKDYLTIIDMDGKMTRLKGTLFAENFNGPDWIKAEIAKIDKPDSENILIDQNLAEEADARLQEAIRRTAQYNSKRYSMKEEEDEQSTGKQPETKGATNVGSLGKSNESNTGKPAPFQKSADSERNESNALYSEYGLGKGAEIGSEPTQRENVQSDFRENPLLDTSAYPVGRTVGTGSEMAESHRRAVKHIHERSNKNSQDSFGAGTGDYRGEPGKSGGDDEADHGQLERTAQQGFQFGELIQNFRSLQKDTEKLESSLARLSQADKELPDFELDLRPAIENLSKIAVQPISTLRQANEARLLRYILNQSISVDPVDTGNLLIIGNEAVKWLRVANEQKLLQKLAKSGMTLAAPDLEKFSFLASTLQHNLTEVHDIKLVADLAKVPFSLRVPDLGSLTQEAIRVWDAMRMAVEFRQMGQLKQIVPSLEPPPLQILASNGKIACDSLRMANDFMILRQLSSHKPALDLPNTARLGSQARFALKRLKIAHETSLVAKIYKAERQHRKIIKNCYLSAEWAGSDLRRWDRVFTEYKKYPKRMKIMNGLIAEAHSRFLGILAETGKMEEVQKHCGSEPFLLYEYGVLKKKVYEYEARQAELEMKKDSGEIKEVSQIQISAKHEFPKGDPCLRM